MRRRTGPAPCRAWGSVPVDELPAAVRERLSDELIDELLAGAGSEEEIVGPGGVASLCCCKFAAA
jgi:hypothetical protein